MRSSGQWFKGHDPKIVRDFGIDTYTYPSLTAGGLLNRGVAISHGEHIVFVYADVELSPDG
jgi:hypothetical protein